MISREQAIEKIKETHTNSTYIKSFSEYENRFEFVLGYEVGLQPSSETLVVDRTSGEITVNNDYTLFGFLDFFPEYQSNVPERKATVTSQKMYIRCGDHSKEVLISPREARNLLKHRTGKAYLPCYLDTKEAYVFYTADDYTPWLVYKDSMGYREAFSDTDYGIDFADIQCRMLS